MRLPLLKRKQTSPLLERAKAISASTSQENPLRKGSSRIPELDLLRFVAAAVVVTFHFYEFLPGDTVIQQAILALGRFGFLGVPLFFMISGFVILWTAFNRTPREFVIARLCRLYPSYIVSVLVTCAMLAYAGGPVAWPRILANLTMFHHFLGYTSIDQVYWTLFIELKFYGLVLILLACRQLPQVERWLAVWLGLSAMSLVAGLGRHSPIPALDTIVFEGSAIYFASGCYAYLIRTRGPSVWRWSGFASSVMLSLLAACKFQQNYTHANDWGALAATIAIMLAMQGAFLAIAMRRWSLPAWRLWYWLGSLTYPLYLLHAMAGKSLYRILPAEWSVWTRLSVTLGAVLAVSTALAVVIEQRGCNALYRLLSGLGRRQPLVSAQISAQRDAGVGETALVGKGH